MFQTEYGDPTLALKITAHEDAQGKLLMVEARAEETDVGRHEPPISVSVVIDRSGSMAGDKLKIAKVATARLIESLRQDDSVAVVTYDDEVNTLIALSQPRPTMSKLVQSIQPGGSTNLFGGWIQGAKLQRGGGRVLLLSDGLANTGRYFDAVSLSAWASKSFKKYGVATSTVGIGNDYDEGLMAGMAASGGGFHYYAQSAESIMDAFARERYLVSALAISDAQLRVGDRALNIGQLLEGETKVVVVPIDELPDTAKLNYLNFKTEDRVTADVKLPTVFAHAPITRAHFYVQLAADLMMDSLGVRSSNEAGNLRESVRKLLLKVLNHELSDQEPLSSLATELSQKGEELEQLQRRFDERIASAHRKRSASMGFNLRERGKAFSSSAADVTFIGTLHQSAYSASDLSTCDARAFTLRPAEFWIGWPAVPLKLLARSVRVGLQDPLDGFAITELSRELGMRVLPDKRRWSADEIRDTVLKA